MGRTLNKGDGNAPRLSVEGSFDQPPPDGSMFKTNEMSEPSTLYSSLNADSDDTFAPMWQAKTPAATASTDKGVKPRPPGRDEKMRALEVEGAIVALAVKTRRSWQSHFYIRVAVRQHRGRK